MQMRLTKILTLIALGSTACGGAGPDGEALDEPGSFDESANTSNEAKAEAIGTVSSEIAGFQNYAAPEIGIVAQGNSVNALGGRCTGTAISSNVILTAAHCVPIANFFYTIEPPLAVVRYTVQQTWTHNRYVPRGDPMFDIALLKIHWSQRVPFTRPMKEHGPVNATASIWGFGGNSCPNRDTNDGLGIKRIGFFTTQANNIIHTPVITCPGDSGAPIMDWADGAIFGVLSGGDYMVPGGIDRFAPTNGPNTWAQLNFVTYIYQAESNQGR